MKTIKQKEALKALRPRSRILSFREFCEYVYDPSKRIRSLNLPEDQKQEAEEAIKERLRP